MCPRRSNGVALLMATARLVDYSRRERQRKMAARSRAAYHAPRMSMPSGLEGLEQIDNMDGASFEYYVAGLLQRNGFRNVRVTKESGDYGVDVIAYKNGESYAFQCKCYHGSVGVRAVQEVSSGAAFYGLQNRVVITNSHFSKNAGVMAQRLGVQLWDRNTLIRLMRTQSSAQWNVNKSKKKVALVVLIVIGAVLHFTLIVSALTYTPEESAQPIPSQKPYSSVPVERQGGTGRILRTDKRESFCGKIEDIQYDVNN